MASENIIIENDTGKESYPESINEIQTSDIVKGGSDGACNLQAQQLAFRTQYLKSHLDNVENIISWFTPRVAIKDMSVVGTVFQFDIAELNFRLTLTKTTSSNINMGVSSLTGNINADIKKLAFYDNALDNAAFDNLLLTTTVNIIDGTIYLATRDNPKLEIWVGAQCWTINVLISGSSAERVRVVAQPVTGIPVPS